MVGQPPYAGMSLTPRLLQSLRNACQRSHILDVVASDLLDGQRLAESAVLLVVQSHLKAIQISHAREPTPGGHFFEGSARDRQHQASLEGAQQIELMQGDSERAYTR
jgi:hypothetical protein